MLLPRLTRSAESSGLSSLFTPFSSRAHHKEYIRRTRRNALDGYLLLGTAANTPTFSGMVRFISRWVENHLHERHKLIIAGFGTERLAPRLNGESRIELVGTLKNGHLDELLRDVRACICYQEAGAGALTKITELMIANVPVIANEHAARSHYDWPGVKVFRSFSELDEILNNGDHLGGSNRICLPRRSDELAVLDRLRCCGDG